ncbi:MAG: hypothetical protein HY332_21255 [Chloroflexi bacterium]|nr:hypothetical protein [Chloroflexota bacterium]
MAAVEASKSTTGRRRLIVGAAVLALAAVGIGGAAVVLPRSGQPLPDGERRQLLERAGLPSNFPIHPYARRRAQPSQGGFSYALAEPVPLALSWQRDSLRRFGYEVFLADVEGQDEYQPHWLYFKGTAGESGAIIIRADEHGPSWGTEVKILSRADARLISPPLPPR